MMKNENWIKRRVKTRINKRLKALMKCLHSGKQLKSNEMISSSESLATRDYSASVHSTRAVDAEQEPDTGKIEEAELSLRENGSLNYEVFLYQNFAPTALKYLNTSLSELCLSHTVKFFSISWSSIFLHYSSLVSLFSRCPY